MKNPCKDCRERVLACHARCVKYNDWKKEHRDTMKKIYADEAYKSYMHDAEKSMRSSKGKNPALKMHKNRNYT